jgi:hypothetical protein
LQVNTNDGKPPTGVPGRNGTPCGKCKLTFYFYFSRGGGYKNAIWVHVENINALEVWIRIGVNHTGTKKVEIWSRCALDCPGIEMEYRHFALPPTFNIPGIYKTVERVHNITWDEILLQICNFMPCVCNASCI